MIQPLHGVLKLKFDDRWVLRQSDLDIASYEVGDYQNLILVCLSVMHIIIGCAITENLKAS